LTDSLFHRQVEAEKGSAAFAFTLATLTGNADLIKHTAIRAARIQDLNGPELHASQHWKDKLVSISELGSETIADPPLCPKQAAWRTLHTAKCFEDLCNMMLKRPACYKNGLFCSSPTLCEETGEAVWHQLVGAAVEAFSLGTASDLPQEALRSSTVICEDYKKTMGARLDRLQTSWLKWSEFPVGGEDLSKFCLIQTISDTNFRCMSVGAFKDSLQYK